MPKKKQEEKMTKKRGPSELDRKMMEQGYLSVAMVAEKLGVHIATIYRKLELGELKGREIIGRKYVELESAVKLAGGTENARLVGLLS